MNISLSQFCECPWNVKLSLFIFLTFIQNYQVFCQDLQLFNFHSANSKFFPVLACPMSIIKSPHPIASIYIRTYSCFKIFFHSDNFILTILYLKHCSPSLSTEWLLIYWLITDYWFTLLNNLIYSLIKWDQNGKCWGKKFAFFVFISDLQQLQLLIIHLPHIDILLLTNPHIIMPFVLQSPYLTLSVLPLPSLSAFQPCFIATFS